MKSKDNDQVFFDENCKLISSKAELLSFRVSRLIKWIRIYKLYSN